MNKPRMTLEELKDLKPNLDNPIELVCDDGFFAEKLAKISVIGFSDSGLINMIDSHKVAYTLAFSSLKHYPSLKQQPKYETLYECVDVIGSVFFLFKDGKRPLFGEKEKARNSYPEHLIRKTGRTLLLNMDTWGIESE